MFASAVYRRGAMTLQALREKIGNDDTFFRILRNWTAEHRHGNATTAQFIDLAERISGLDLGAFFQTWLYTRRQADDLVIAAAYPRRCVRTCARRAARRPARADAARRAPPAAPARRAARAR